MSPLVAAKLALTAAGVVAFGVGLRTDTAAARWAGIALVAIAFLLRFYRPRV